MAFTTAAQLKTALAAMLNIAEASVPDKYTNSITADANASAYAAIIRALVNRGFTKTQIDTWVDGAEFNRDIGLYFALLKGNGLDKIDGNIEATWKLLDRRLELDTIVILDSNYEMISPDSSSGINTGAISTTNDLYSLDPDDIRIGEVTEW